MAGVDTIRLTWRGGAAASWVAALAADTLDAPALDAWSVRVMRLKSGRMVRCPATGVRFGYVETPGDYGGYYPWVEHRAGALMAGDRRDRSLLPQVRLAQIEAAATSLVAAYGISVCPASECRVQRYDLTVDLHALDVAEELRGVALMAALARLDLIRLKRSVTHARESSRVQSVSWFHQGKVNTKGKVKRQTRVLAYQKAEELRERQGENVDARPGSITRIEVRVWPSAKDRPRPAELAYEDLRPRIAGYFAKYDLANLKLSHPSDALRLLAVRIGELELRGKRSDGTPRKLTPRVAERMGGTLLVALAGLEDVFWKPQTRRARKAELRRAGLLTSTDAVRDAPPVDLGEYLRFVIDAFMPPPVEPEPEADAEPPEQPSPTQLELPGMPAAPTARARWWVH